MSRAIQKNEAVRRVDAALAILRDTALDDPRFDERLADFKAALVAKRALDAPLTKSEIVAEAARKRGLRVIDIKPASFDLSDVRGLPVRS